MKKNNKEGVLDIWENEEGSHRTGFITGWVLVPLDEDPVAPCKIDEIPEIAAVSVKTPQVTTNITMPNRYGQNDSRFCKFDYTVYETGNNHYGDNYIKSKRESLTREGV